VRLFERLGRRLYITPTGEQLCEYARHILSTFDSMEQRLRNADDTDMLRIGATVTVGTCILGDVLKRYIAETGHPAPRVLVDNTQVIEQQLLKSELDAAIVEGSISSPDLVTQCMMNDPLALVCAAHHNPFGERRCVSMAELQRIPFILREKGSGTREVFERAMPHINAQWVCNNSEAILHGVEQGFGVVVTTLETMDGEQGVRKVDVLVRFMGLDVVTITAETRTCDAKDALDVSKAQDLGAMTDSEFQTWFVKVMNNLQNLPMTLLMSLPESVLTLLMGGSN